MTKQKSSIPVILRDMAPPEGSIFDPATKWKEEKDKREKAAGIEADAEAKQVKKGGGGGGGGGGHVQVIYMRCMYSIL